MAFMGRGQVLGRLRLYLLPSPAPGVAGREGPREVGQVIDVATEARSIAKDPVEEDLRLRVGLLQDVLAAKAFECLE